MGDLIKIARINKFLDLIHTNSSKHKIFGCDAFETEMSDHHLMIYGYFKSTFSNLNPKNKFYRDY